ncbi:hypothetical protein C8R45DRAFT_1115834 [Mycena sanguinolenta]|nr:hypothetical protein C8R45DRAFT_1115834 [Mycena sanguinolenta]
MSNACSNVEYMGTAKRSPDFFRVVESWSKNIGFLERPHKDATEYSAILMGEIAHPALGTQVSARGNHYDGRVGEPVKYIDDKSKIKDVLVLRAPTLCPPELQATWEDQRALIMDIENTEKYLDASVGWNPSFRSCLRSSTVEKPREDLITIHTGKKYGVPASAGGPRVAVDAPPALVRVRRRGEEDDGASNGGSVQSTHSDGPTGPTIPSEDDIKLGAYYDPRLLEDYGGPLFRHANAKLVQLDIRDAANRLIAPWNQYTALRPGSFILASVTFHVYTFEAEGNDRDRDRKHVQLNARTIRVLDESDFPVQKRPQPGLRAVEGGGPSTPTRNSAVNMNKSVILSGFAGNALKSFSFSFVYTPRTSPTKPVVGGDGDGDEEEVVVDKQADDQEDDEEPEEPDADGEDTTPSPPKKRRGNAKSSGRR